MKLYHYTTFSNFCSIWMQQRLKFSEWTNCNDVYEREKAFNFTQNSREYNGKVFTPEVFKKFTSNVYNEIKMYRQVSFCMDYKDGVKGYASPIMWGHYARDHQRSGVCIEFDYSKIKYSKQLKLYKGKVYYKTCLGPTHMGGVDAEMNDAAQQFVILNQKELFFNKHKHWKYENEYRFISKGCDFLDISDAITSIYVLGEDEITLESVRRIIMDSEKVTFLNVGGIKTLILNPINLYDYEIAKEELKYFAANPHLLFQKKSQ